MAATYLLTPIDRNHECWVHSKIAPQRVQVLADDSRQARRRTSGATDCAIMAASPDRRSLLVWHSPWERADVTSCELDPSPPDTMPSEFIVCEIDGKLPAPWG